MPVPAVTPQAAEVVVIGAGPAGSACVAAAARGQVTVYSGRGDAGHAPRFLPDAATVRARCVAGRARRRPRLRARLEGLIAGTNDPGRLFSLPGLLGALVA